MAPFSVTERLRSFRFALAGIRTLVAEQHNARIHLLATVVVVAAAAYFDVNPGEWLALMLAVALVWLAEAMNSALEYLCDAAVPDEHALIRKAKDVAAGGVLICAGFAVVVAAVVFLPRF